MKRATFILFFATATTAMLAQTLNVVTSDIMYQIPAEQAGDMLYSNDGTITILGKSFAINDITDMYVDRAEVVDNSISISYNGTSATVVVAGNCMRYLTIDVSGANVIIEQSDDLSDELTYSLSGSSSDGSFYMDGKLKATVELNNLTLTSNATAPINIKNGKRIKIKLVGTTTLKDSASSDGKGALMVNGHSEIEGSGTLNLYGYTKHAYWADEYVQLKKSMTGTINILHAESDGINVNQYFEQNGGTLNISGTGDDGIQVSADDDTGSVVLSGGTLNITVNEAGSKGIKAEGDVVINDDKDTPTLTITNSGAAYYDTASRDIKGSSCISSDTNVLIDAGVINLSATGKGGKGIKADNVFTMNNGTLTITTTGTRFSYGNNTSSPKGIRAGTKAASRGTPTGDLVINGGEIDVVANGQADGSEGIESKNTLYINGGNVTVTAYDDAINSAKNMYIEGGTVEVVSKSNDGLDSNANLYINGGTVLAYGAGAPECSIDAAEGYNLYFNGGVILGVGGSSITPASSSSQSYVSTTGTITAKSTIKLSNGGDTLCSFVVPSNYSSNTSSGGMGNMGGMGGGPGGGGNMGNSGYQIIISCPELKSGSSYTLTNGTSSATVKAK